MAEININQILSIATGMDPFTKGRGFGYAKSAHLFNSLSDVPYLRERGRGFSYVGNV